MRLIPAQLRMHLEAGATTLAYVWLVRRRDGDRFAFTDHDRDLRFDDLIAPARSALTPMQLEKTDGLGPDLAAVEGALSAEALTAEDLAAGVWDGAEAALWRVDWTDTSVRVHVFAGQLGEIRSVDGRFSVELRGLKAQLDRPIGRLFARQCDADLGDARCGVDLSGRPGATCDKRFETCRDIYANTLNFQGFPHLPGMEALVAPIHAGARRDGGSMWRP